MPSGALEFGDKPMSFGALGGVVSDRPAWAASERDGEDTKETVCSRCASLATGEIPCNECCSCGESPSHSEECRIMAGGIPGAFGAVVVRCAGDSGENTKGGATSDWDEACPASESALPAVSESTTEGAMQSPTGALAGGESGWTTRGA